MWAHPLEGDLTVCKTKFMGVLPNFKSFVHAPPIAPDKYPKLWIQVPCLPPGRDSGRLLRAMSSVDFVFDLFGGLSEEMALTVHFNF